jgi:hypothetical protein
LSLKSTSCLFERWRSESAPVFHMSEFWPAFAEPDIEAFINSEIAEPKASKPLNTELATSTRRQIQAFVDSLSSLSPDAFPCAGAYRDFELERLAALDLVLAGSDRGAAARANDTQFGRLEDMYFQPALSHLAHYINGLEPASAPVKDAQQRLLGYWSDVKLTPALDTVFADIEHARVALRPYVEKHFGFVGKILAAYPDGETIPSSAVREILNSAFSQILQYQDTPWEAVLKPAAPNIFIDNDRRAIVVPEGREYTKDHVSSLIIHEIGVHVLRADNGAHSHEPLAGYGMAGSSPAEEAFGVLLGNALPASYQQINALAPLAILEYANRPGNPGFRDVFNFAADLVLCLANPGEVTHQTKSYRYQRAAFARTIRVLRLGHSGLIERSTTKYWYGLTLMSAYLKNLKLTEENLQALFIGKYDPRNETQFKLITAHK